MSEPALKCENQAIFKQNLLFKRSIIAVLAKKSFITSTTGGAGALVKWLWDKTHVLKVVGCFCTSNCSQKFVSIGQFYASLDSFTCPMVRVSYLHCAIRNLSISGQSYKASTIVYYDSRVVPDLKIPHIMTRVVIYDRRGFIRLATGYTYRTL